MRLLIDKLQFQKEQEAFSSASCSVPKICIYEIRQLKKKVINEIISQVFIFDLVEQIFFKSSLVVLA